MNSLFLFHRDLRLEDNTGLIAALENSTQVLPCFILDPQQLEQNPYKGLASIQFMVESLIDLHHQLQQKKGQLLLAYGDTATTLTQLITQYKIAAVYANKDYTPFSQQRDAKISAVCQAHNIPFHCFDDALLHPPTAYRKEDGTPYRVFTPFYRYAQTLPVAAAQKNPYHHYYQLSEQTEKNHQLLHRILPQHNTQLAAQGGRTACLTQLQALKKIADYERDHDFPALAATSGLSPHLKFTTCSVREIYAGIHTYLKNPQPMLRQLYWRDFFTTIAFYYPHVLGHAFQKSYDSLAWENNEHLFAAWCAGKTGFPIVDAGMQELNTTGGMHNRVRLITASFLVKDLLIDWRWGECYFAQHLVDYDPAVNNGNWQWVASTGTDAQPYFRIFNPWLQQKKFDPDCSYIKHWLPALRDVDPAMIHHWYETQYHTLVKNYPSPIVDHTSAAAKAKDLFLKKMR